MKFYRQDAECTAWERIRVIFLGQGTMQARQIFVVHKNVKRARSTRPRRNK
jgi:hypothetical protein